MHSSEYMVREAKIKISHLRVSTASALREEVNVMSPALYLSVVEPEDSKIRLLHNKERVKKKRKESFLLFFSLIQDVKIPTCIYSTVELDLFLTEPVINHNYGYKWFFLLLN